MIALTPMLLAAVLSFAQDIVVREGLATGDVPRGGRSPVHADPVEALLVAGVSPTPQAWQAIEADDDGWFRGPALEGGYLLATVERDAPGTMILDARGHGMVYVNGVPRAGDPYSYGFVRLPVPLHAGVNELLFRVTRGRLRATLAAPAGPVTLDTADATLPDIIEGETGPYDAAVVVINATPQWQSGLTLAAGRIETAVPPIGPYAVRKVPFRCSGESSEVVLELRRGAEHLDEATVTLKVRQPGERHVRTFVSKVDGSVQYYAVTPASRDDATALVLTLHGAGVEARRQVAVYAPKTWTDVVAPTNRRPFGFDWEDWGRMDALEVLDRAMRARGTDPQRVYLTGHSMGGHGVWYLGVTYADRFAAIGPSAGWASFFTYAGGTDFGGDDDPRAAVLARAQECSRTRDMVRNLTGRGVYILHGDQDDNVPVGEARAMRGILETFHHDVAYHEEPGAGHWWGDRCCDWAPMFDFFHARARGPAPAGHIVFATANPGISATSGWACIESQVVPLALSSIEIDLDGQWRHADITTSNVASLRLGPYVPDTVTIDGQTLAGASPRRLVRDGDRWSIAAGAAPPERKGPHRYGPFKDVFRHRPVLVYGTAGSQEETDLAYRKARYDAETFWYRGNGVLEVTADRDFDPDADADRNVILYGNADTNSVWPALLAGSPVRVARGGVTVAGRRIAGDELACLFIRPRPGSDVACVGAVSGTGPKGMRLTGQLPYFVSGVHYPDCIVIGPDMLTDTAGGGLAGIRVAGIFGLDWSVDAGDFAWRDERSPGAAP